MNNKKLNKVRNLIDKLDIQLLNLIKKRTKLVNHVIKIKKYKKQIKNLKSFEKISYYKSLNRSAISEYSRFGHILLMSNNISLLKKDSRKLNYF